MSGRGERDSHVEEVMIENLQYMPDFITNYFYSAADKTSLSKNNYLGKISKFIDYLNVFTDIDIENPNSYKDIKPSDISYFLNSELDVSNSTKAGYYYAIKSMFDFLENDDYIIVNPCRKVKPPKDKTAHTITYLTPEEIQTVKKNIEEGVGTDHAKKIQEKTKNRDMAILMLGLSTGLRVGSIVEIDIEDIDFENNRIMVTEKGNKQRSILLSKELMPIINKCIEERKNLTDCEGGPLFVSYHGERMRTKNIHDLMKKYTYNIDKKITPHKLRSTYATNAIKQTGNIYLVAHQLGHSNIQNTKRYAGIDKEMEEKAATAMDKILF